MQFLPCAVSLEVEVKLNNDPIAGDDMKLVHPLVRDLRAQADRSRFFHGPYGQVARQINSGTRRVLVGSQSPTHAATASYGHSGACPTKCEPPLGTKLDT